MLEEEDSGAVPYTLDENGNLAIPSITTTDYIEMVVLVFLLIFGIPLNTFVLKRLLNAWNDGNGRQKVSFRRLYKCVVIFVS